MGYGSEAIIQRIGVKTNKGIISTPLGANMQVKYNLDSDQTLLRIFSDWADSHGRKVLMPFTANCSIDALRACDTYIALAADKKYLMGRIADCGEPWDANHPQDTPGYSVPDDYMAASQTFWVALDDVEYGDEFDFTNWWTSPAQGTEINSLEQMFTDTKVAMMYASRIDH
ncbi:hypothetical protein [Bifidobacterium pseudolongum]|uniref:hypothetical protein n=1 Tax=Bifidobacterium pseudolongum TaxID=1694 RepID=UPI001020F4E1|nr:hypothetical protein [Bifidobacterium pseudolongum]RYQ41908.1 hypothetical protein PG1791B_1685 [Bifidobacterium pseudolongum subsp. globosum]